MYDHIIIAGDFNVNLLISNATANHFVDLIESFNLSVINSFPTHFTAHSASLLDLFLVSNPEQVVFYNQIAFPGFSNHDLIFLTYDVGPIDRQEQVFTFYDFEAVDLDYLLSQASTLNWEQIYFMTSPEEQWDHLEYLINLLFHNHVPLKTRRIYDSSCPWFTETIKILISQRDHAYARWKRFRTTETREQFRRLRNVVNKEIQRSKVRFYGAKLDVKLSARKLWRNIRDIGIGRPKYSHISKSPHELNLSFIYNTSNVDAHHDGPLSSYSAPTFNSFDGFSFTAVTPYDVHKVLIDIKSNACGLDNVHPRFIKIISPVILPFITHFFNTILLTSIYPSKWKQAKIIPIPKVSRSAVQEYRPIAVLPYLSKVFEKLMYIQMVHFIDAENTLSQYQSGFRSEHSCVTALVKVSDDIRDAVDRDMMSILVLLDFSKAFDRVDHSRLIHKLSTQFSFTNSACKLLSTYLQGRVQKVYCNGVYSSFLHNYTGVPQGSILGPLLFSIYINDISLIIKNCNFHMYADDLQLYISRPIGLTEDAVCRMNEDITSICRWAENNGLLLNASKSESIVIYRSEIDTSCFPKVLLYDVEIPYKDTVRNLGIIFNKTLSWSNQINSIVSRIYGTLRKLWLSAAYTPRNTKMLLVKTLLVPLITYGCEIFCRLDSASQRKLNVAFNSAVRYIFNLRRYDHVSPYADCVLGCTLMTYIEFRTILFLRNIILKQNPRYLFNKISFMQSQRTSALSVPQFRFICTERQFIVQAVRMWNSLPVHIRRNGHGNNFNSNFNFKKTLFMYLRNE